MWLTDPVAFPTISAGCRWPIPEAACEMPADLSEDLTNWVKQAAVDILWTASGRRYGLCDRRPIRPCLPGCDPGWQNIGWETQLAGTGPYWGPPMLRLTRCGRCDRSCSCTRVHEIELWDRDVRRIRSVIVDGVTLGPSLYRRQGRWLMRLAGQPYQLDLSTADVDDGVQAEVGDVVITGDVADAGEVLEFSSGSISVDLGAARRDLTLTVVMADTDTITIEAGVTVSGAGVVEAGVVTSTGGTVILHYPQGTDLAAIDVDQAVELTAVQWSDLTVANPGWPKCQDRNVGAGEVGSWTVQYLRGTPVPAGGQLAAALYACELGKALIGDDDCALPMHVITKAVDGQVLGFLDPLTVLQDGVTGMGGLVDQWILRANPSKLQRQARAFRADDPRLARRRG